MCIPVSLRNTRKILNRFIFFRTNVIYISQNGIYLHPSPKLFDPVQFVLEIPGYIFPGASIHWNISLKDSILVYWFVPKKPSSLTDFVHWMGPFGIKEAFRGRIHHLKIAKILVFFLRKWFMHSTQNVLWREWFLAFRILKAHQDLLFSCCNYFQIPF